jgi:hypothetical protein
MYRRFLATILSVSVLLGPFNFCQVEVLAQAAAPKAGTADQQAMDKLMAPVALYPDALLAQVLACAGSPQQVTEVNKWLVQNSQLTGTELQQAAESAGFDASFVAMVLFPDVLKLLEQNLPWATELGKAFTSDQKGVLDSVQRLRAQAKAAGNLKTTPQQEVKTETQNGQTVIVVQPANPQVIYVPTYNPQTVYVAQPPPPSNSGNVAAAAVIGFAVGIALGAAMNDHYGYYGWGAWGMHWHTSVVVVHGGVWRAPVGHYGYARPVAGYHPNHNINAPRHNDINVNINNNNINNVSRQNVNTGGRTPRPTNASAASRSGQARTSNAGATRSQPAGNAYRGRAQATSSAPASPARQIERGSSTSAFSGYQKGSSEKGASTRGRSSARSKTGNGRRK